MSPTPPWGSRAPLGGAFEPPPAEVEAAGGPRAAPVLCGEGCREGSVCECRRDTEARRGPAGPALWLWTLPAEPGAMASAQPGWASPELREPTGEGLGCLPTAAHW